MANYLSKINFGGTIYSLKDSEARIAIATLQSAVASALVFKGVISSATELTDLTDYKLGWTYKANASFFVPLVGTIEVGDMIICVSDYSESYKASDWTVVQNNVDVMVGATAETAGTTGLVPAPKTDETDKFLQGDGTWGSPSIQWGTFSNLN